MMYILVTGATGVGKTYLLSAFGREACIRGCKVKSFRVPRMLTDLQIGRVDGSYNKLLIELTKPDLLILDDFGLKQIELGLSQDFLEVMEKRHPARKSTAISAQLPVKEWHQYSKMQPLRMQFWIVLFAMLTALRLKVHPDDQTSKLKLQMTARLRHDILQLINEYAQLVCLGEDSCPNVSGMESVY